MTRRGLQIIAQPPRRRARARPARATGWSHPPGHAYACGQRPHPTPVRQSSTLGQRLWVGGRADDALWTADNRTEPTHLPAPDCLRSCQPARAAALPVGSHNAACGTHTRSAADTARTRGGWNRGGNNGVATRAAAAGVVRTPGRCGARGGTPQLNTATTRARSRGRARTRVLACNVPKLHVASPCRCAGGRAARVE